MTMGSVFGESAAPYYAAEEDYLDPLANTGDIPYAAPVYGPPSPTGGINPNQGGFRGPENPANIEPGPNADFLGPLLDAYNTDIPYYSDFARDTLTPLAGDVYNQMFPGPAFLSDALGGPDFGQTLSQFTTPVSAGDVAMTLMPGVGDLPIDDLVRNAPDLARGAFRAAMPEPNLAGANFGAGIPPGGQAWDESVLGPLPGGLDNYQRAQPVLDPLAPPQTPAVPDFPQRYPSIPEGTMGSEFPEIAGTMQYNTEGRLARVDPNSPAARMGAPLAYDPQFMGPPPADAAMRELGVAPGTDRPLWEMSYNELDEAAKAAKAAEANLDREILGPRLDEYNRAQRVENSMSASREAQDQARRTIEEIEGSLTQEQQNRLFGIGQAGPMAEDFASMRHAIGSLDWDSPEALGRSISRDITNIRPGVDPTTLTGDQLESYAKIRAAMTGATEAGWNLSDVSGAALRGAAGRFSDPDDVEFMLRDFMQQPSAPRPAASPSPLGLPSGSVDDTAQQMRDAFEGARREESILTGGVQSPPVNDELRIAQEFVRNAPSGGTVPASSIGPTRDEEFARFINGPDFRHSTQSAIPGAARGVESAQEAIETGRRLGYSDADIAAYLQRNHLGGGNVLTGGGSTPNPPSAELGLGSPPPASNVEIPTNPQPTVFDAEALRRGDNGAGTRTDEILGNASPTAVQREAASIAPNLGMTANQANDILKNWEFNAQITQDYVNNPTGLARLASVAERPVEGGITGNFSDSFVTGLMQRRSDLEQTLQRGTSWTPQQIKTAVDSAVEQRLQRHYANNPTGLTSTKQTLTEAEAKATELAKDFKGLNTFVERTKNTMFPLDFGFLGQNILTGMRQGGVTTLIGMANRVAQAVNLPFAVDLEKATGLPRMLAASNDGLRLGNVASGLKPDEGTLLRYIPGLSPIDKHAITPLIGKLTDAQYTGLGGFLKMMNYEGNLAVLGAAGKDIADPAVRREAARVTNNAWSSAATATTPGRAQAEKLSFTSPAFTRSQVGVLTDMAKLIIPGASETQRILAATAILSNAVMIAAIYKTLNDQFGVGDAQLDPTKPGFGNIILDSKNSDGKNQVVNMFPQRSFQTAITRAVDAAKDMDPEALAEAIAKLGAGRAGALPSGAARGAGFGYDTQGQFHMGGMPWQERIKASIPAPVSLQNTFTGGATDPTTMALELGGVPNYPESTGSQMYREGQDVNAIRSGITLDSGVLSAAFPNNPELANAVRGQDWNALTTEERKALIDADRSLYPGHANALDALDETRKQYNEEKPTAISNRIRIQQETDERISGIRKEYGVEFDKIGEKMINGSGDPRVLRQTMTALREQQNQDISVERWKGGTTYAGLPEREGKDGSGRLPNEVQEAISAYYDIGDKIPRVEGKPNFDAIQGAREGFVIDLYRSSPDTANRLDFYLQQRSIEAEAQKSEFMRFWDDTVIPALNRYYDQPEGGRTAWRREHAMDDALLTFGGYMPSTVSPTAAELLKGLAPGRGVK